MAELTFFVLLWGGFGIWLALFAWLAWKAKVRTLFVLGIIMFSACGLIYKLLAGSAASSHDHSADDGYGMLMMLAIAMLILPIVVAAAVYPIGRLWKRASNY